MMDGSLQAQVQASLYKLVLVGVVRVTVVGCQLRLPV